MFCRVLHKKIRFCLLIISCLVFFSACYEKNSLKKEIQKGSFSLLKENDSLYYLTIASANNLDKWKLPYPVYQFQTGDIDGNGIEDAMIGVVKPTRFDSIKGKRLFVFKNYKGLVRPLWLGSRLSQPLVDFSFIKKEKHSRIRSIEREKSSKYLVAEYKWRKFGLEFTKYLKRETDSISAITLIENN